jgi:hypothetical protein
MFSNIEDSNRVIPPLQRNFFPYLYQGFLVLSILLILFLPYLPGEAGDLIYRYIDYFYIALFAMFFLGAIAGNVLVNWNLKRKWEMLASEFALQMEQKNRFQTPTLSGTFRGHQVKIEISAVKTGRSRTYYTNFYITLIAPSSETLSVKKRGLISMNREPVGDDEIDKKLTITTTSDALLQRILANSRLRQGLLELGERARTKELTLAKNNIHYVEQGRISNPEYIQATLRYLSDLANLVERFDRMAF